jgi:hypothetical protein
MLLNRTAKINLLTSLLAGKATAKQVADLRQSQEPIYLTLQLGDDEDPFEQDPDEPTFHIEVYADGTTKSYDRYPNGRIEYRTN